MKSLIVKNNILNHKNFFSKKFLIQDGLGNKKELSACFYMDKEGYIQTKFVLCGLPNRLPHSLKNMQSREMYPLEGIGSLLQERDFENLARDPEKYLTVMLEEIYDTNQPWKVFQDEVKSWVDSSVETFVKPLN